MAAAIDVAARALLHHMRILVEAGLLTREQRGKWVCFELVDGASKKDRLAQEMLMSLWGRSRGSWERS